MFIDIVSDILFPIECVSCHKEENKSWLCQGCLSELSSHSHRVGCFREIHQASGLERGYILFDYTHPVLKSIISGFKYSFISEMRHTIEDLVNVHKNFIKKNISDDNMIIPVPLHKKRLHLRGYNQAAAIAQIISRISGASVEEGLVMRMKNTKPQAALQRQSRLNNLIGAFAISSEKAAPKRCVVVDDVFTTGATMREVARILRLHGAREVIGMAFAGSPLCLGKDY